MDISTRLRQLMAAQNITIPDLSKATGISTNTIKNYIYKNQEPRSRTVTALEKYFGVSREYLLGETASSADAASVIQSNYEGSSVSFVDSVTKLLTVSASRTPDASVDQKQLQEKFTGIVEELRHVMGKKNGVQSLDALQKTFYITTRFCDLADSMDSSEIFRMQRTLEDSSGAYRDALEDYAAGVHNLTEFPQYIRFKVSDQPASAGTGVYLGPDAFTEMDVPQTSATQRAAFGVPVSGDSMEPKYHNGDILLVAFEEAAPGDVAVVTMDGCGYVKKIGDGVLLSLNRKYAPIPMDDSIRISGKVIGVLPSGTV